MEYLKKNWLPLIVIATGACATLALSLAPYSFLMWNFIPDDSFYYFEIARNIVHGLGPTFDGINLTDGYHPLWLLVLVPIFHFFSVGGTYDMAPVRAALVFSALLNAGLGIALWRICSRYSKEAWIIAVAIGVWFFNPFNLFAMLDGLETPLSLFFIAAFFLAAIRTRERPSIARYVIAGALAGLMMLSRLDNVFYFVMFLFWLLYDQGIVKETISRVLYAGFSATAIVAPWLIWNFSTFGTLFTSSSIATTLVNHQLIVQDHGPSILQKLKAVIYTSDYWVRRTIDRLIGAPSLILVLLGVTIGWRMFVPARRFFEKKIPLEWFFAGGFVLDFIANAAIRWSPRDWYFVPLNIFIALWIAWLLETLRREGKLHKILVFAVILSTLYLFFVAWSKNLRNQYALGDAVVSGAQWMNENLPEGATVGSFNAGMLGYFSNHRVINLDGLVNNAALGALERRQLWDYIASQHIDYVTDFHTYFTYRFKSFFGVDDIFSHLTPIPNAPTSSLEIYKVKQGN